MNCHLTHNNIPSMKTMKSSYCPKIMKSNILLLVGLLSFSHVVYAGDNNNKPDTGLNSQKNPFVKVSPSATILPNGLPVGTNVINSGNIASALPNTNPRGLFALDENSQEQRTDWDNLKVVGFLNDYVILRYEENNGNNNSNNGNNNSNGNNNGNNNNEPKTIFTQLDNKFFLNKNQYTIKYTNKIFTIYNKNNQPVHKLTIGNGAAHLIPRNSGGNGGNNSSGGGYNFNVNSGSQNGSNTGK